MVPLAFSSFVDANFQACYVTNVTTKFSHRMILNEAAALFDEPQSLTSHRATALIDALFALKALDAIDESAFLHFYRLLIIMAWD